MKTDQETLNFAAAVLCGLGSLGALVAAFGDRKNGPRGAVMSGLAATIGSAAWAIAAWRDLQQRTSGSSDLAASTLTPAHSN